MEGGAKGVGQCFGFRSSMRTENDKERLLVYSVCSGLGFGGEEDGCCGGQAKWRRVADRCIRYWVMMGKWNQVDVGDGKDEERQKEVR